jgi:hypothetical protein
MPAMVGDPGELTSDELDEQDRIAVLQMRTLTMEQRLNYFADDVDFEADPVE